MQCGNVAVLIGNGDGTFQAAQSYASGIRFAASIAMSDVNSDGKLDLLVANGCSLFSSSSVPHICGVGVLLGNGDGTFQPSQGYSSGGFGPDSIAVEDVNGDGKPDVIVSNACVIPRDCGSGIVGVLLAN